MKRREALKRITLGAGKRVHQRTRIGWNHGNTSYSLDASVHFHVKNVLKSVLHAPRLIESRATHTSPGPNEMQAPRGAGTEVAQ